MPMKTARLNAPRSQAAWARCLTDLMQTKMEPWTRKKWPRLAKVEAVVNEGGEVSPVAVLPENQAMRRRRATTRTATTRTATRNPRSQPKNPLPNRSNLPQRSARRQTSKKELKLRKPKMRQLRMTQSLGSGMVA